MILLIFSQDLKKYCKNVIIINKLIEFLNKSPIKKINILSSMPMLKCIIKYQKIPVSYKYICVKC